MWGHIQVQWLKESLTAANWPSRDVALWAKRKFNLNQTTVKEIIVGLNVEQAKLFVAEINGRLGVTGKMV